MAGLADFVDEPTEELHLMQIEYREHFGEPVIHTWCRTEDGERRHVEIEGHRPSFYIHEDAFDKRLRNHDWVEDIEHGFESIHGDPLVRVYTRLPKHVGGGRDIDKGLREYFDRTWEGDVFFTSRFLIDTGIHTHFEVELDQTWSGQHMDGDYRVHVDDIEPIEDPSWRATPRAITADIEVLSPHGFPDAADAEHPVTGITAYDNYDEKYTLWLLRHEGWAYSDTEVANIAIENRPDPILVDGEEFNVSVEDVRVFEEESALLHNFNEYVGKREPDLLSGWNSSSTMNGDAFDYPYLVNRCQGLNVTNYRDNWSPMGQVWTTRRGRAQNLTMGGKGVAFFDLMEAYKKTKWSEPKGGWGLSNTSVRELGMDDGKLDLEDIDAAWKSDLAKFTEYNIRDVQAVVAIDAASGATSMYQDIRAIGGVQFENCHNAIDTLDVFIIRMAKQYGYALPTSEKPDRGWYYGAHNFEPILGLHENVVYPDLWSMYPNMVRNVNMSPETLIGTQEELEASEYTEEDCRWTYIDTRRTEVKKESDPRYEKVYFLKPSIKKGFMNEVIDDLMDMKDSYDGTPLYGPLKHNFINAVYGVFGDSDSYGRGYRLFDWRIAEGITLGGRKMIQDSSERFVDAVNELKDEYGYEGNKAYRIAGDTDSVMTSIPFVDVDYEEDFTIEFRQPDGSLVEVPAYYEDFDDIVFIAQEAADRVNEWYEQWTAETFNVEDGDHYCEIEIESFAPRAFVPEGVTKKKAKKRYAEIIAWDEGEWQHPPEFSVTGIDIVRSDRAPVTRDVLEDVLDTILRVDDRDDARRAVYDRIEEEVEAIRNGEREREWFARPKGMTRHPSTYGTPSKKASATYRGARYANENFDWEHLTAGDKPALLYIDKVRGNWPTNYSTDWEVAGAGEPVDAVSGNEPNDIPDEFVVDMDKQLEKVLEDPLTPILAPMRWSYDEALSDTEQGSLSSFM